ncbi:hypothetical protein [Blastopirellula marina]|uniref:Uncharacterized protein n=1 Tax=Blastopirellula marina TaxID=124 RepID=A0A2S8GF99_9BACT|nr:hypothetical protein [Blastopirellula marina]PQO43145.1 hypothetical protein C5Y93_25915 [Blastopirellula marina]
MDERMEAADDRADRFQFGIWHLILATAIASILVAATAPLLREFNATQWLVLGSSATGAAFGGLTFVMLIVYPRLQAAVEGGPLLLQLPISASRETIRDMRVSAAIAWSTLLVYFLYFAKLGDLAEREIPLFQFCAPAALTAVISMSFCNALLVARRPQFRANGLLIGTVYVPWEAVSTCYWLPDQPNRLRIGGPLIAEIDAPYRDRAKIAKLIDQKLNVFVPSQAAPINAKLQ